MPPPSCLHLDSGKSLLTTFMFYTENYLPTTDNHERLFLGYSIWHYSSGGSTLGPGGTGPPNIAQLPPPHPQFLDTVVLLLVELIGSIVN